MTDARTLLAGVLGIGLGLFLIRYPEVVIRVHAVGRVPDGRGSEYGAESSASDRLRRLVQGVGLLLVAAGVYFGVTAVSGAGVF